jgi:hypothetical protein
MAEITVQKCSTTGLELTTTAASSGGDYFTADDVKDYGYILFVDNADGSDHTVTVSGVRTSNQGQTNDNVTTVTAGEARYIRIPAYAINADSRQVSWTYDAVTSVTVAVIEA